MGRSSDRPSDSSRGDSRLREFLRRAGPILAAERGWNPRSRLKLKSLAEDLRLPRQLYDAAIERLHEGQLEWDKQLSLYESRFMEKMRRQWSQSRNQVLTGVHEKKAIRIARRQYQIPKHRARQLLRQVADELGMSRVSQADAIHYVENTIVQAIGMSTQVSPEMRDRLVSAGQRWGVDCDRVELMIQSTLEANRSNAKPHGALWTRVVAGMIATLLMIAVAYFAYSIMGGSGGLNDTPPIDPLEFNRPSTPNELIPPSWWSESTARTFDRLQDQLLDGSVTASKLVSTNDRDRSTAYKELIQYAVTLPAESLSPAGQLIGSLLNDEFEHSVWKLAHERMAGYLSISDEHLPNSAAVYQAAFAANDLLDQCYRLTTDVDKRASIQKLCQRSLDLTSPVGSQQYRQLSQQRIAKRQWRQLRTLSFSQPRQASRLIQPLSQLTADKFADQDRQQFATIMTVLSQDPSIWQNLTESLTPYIETGTQNQVYEIYQQSVSTPNASLSLWLISALARKLDISTKSISVERVRSSVARRLKLDAREFDPLTPRWQKLQSRLRRQQLLAAVAIDKATPQQIADAAFFATLSFSMHQLRDKSGQPPDSAALKFFDGAIDARPRDTTTRIHSGATATNLTIYGRVKRQPLPSDLRWHNDALARLEQFDNLKADVRAVALQRLAESADRFRDIKPDQARAVARYLLHATETADIVAIEKFANRFKHWANLSMAVADEVLTADTTVDHAFMVAQLVTDVEFLAGSGNSGSGNSGSGNSWREALHKNILARVANSLQHTAETEGLAVDYQWDELSDYLAEQYRSRCQLAGVEPGKTSGAVTAADYAALLDSHLRGRSGPTKAQLANGLVARNPMQQFVLLGQILIESTGNQCRSENPARCDSILNQYHDLNRQTTSITQQLLLNELTLIKLWMLSSSN